VFFDARWRARGGQLRLLNCSTGKPGWPSLLLLARSRSLIAALVSQASLKAQYQGQTPATQTLGAAMGRSPRRNPIRRPILIFLRSPYAVKTLPRKLDRNERVRTT
jgi:hypothetical protein